jgi:hypothetical protein
MINAMKTLIPFIILIAIGLAVYFFAIKTKNVNPSGNPTYSSFPERLPLKVFLAADATGSINQNGISVLTGKHLTRIIDTLRMRGGEIALLIIDGNCGKKPLLRVTIHKQPEGPNYPVQAISETAYQYGQRLQQFQKDNIKYMADSTKYFSQTITRIEGFLKDAVVLLDKAYSHLAMSSDCIGALNISTKFQEEPILNNQKMKKISLFISDMQHTSNINNKSSLTEPESSVNYYVVRTKKVQDCLPGNLHYEEFENIDSSIDDILQ